MNSRPRSITILSWIYIAVGTVGFFYHFRELLGGMHSGPVFIESVRVVAVLAGYFMLRGKNSARWVAIAWMGLHVFVSLYNSWPQVLVHTIFFVIITFLLTRPAANLFFRRSNS